MESESRESINLRMAQSGLIFLPNLLGSRSPSWNPNEKGVFFGIERFHERGDLMKSIFESIAFSLREIVEIIESSGTKANKIIGGGGLTKISISNEIKSTITGLPYYTTEESEITSLGAAIIALTSERVYSSNKEACKTMIVEKDEILPNKKFKNYYDDMFGQFLKLTKSMAPFYEENIKIIKKNQVSKKLNLINL